MSLDEEIAIYRFGQGAIPIDALLGRFASLGEIDKTVQVFNLNAQIGRVKPIEADVYQAIADSGLDPDASPCVSLKAYRWYAGVMHMPDDDIDHFYELQLRLFRLAYQRQLALKKDNPTDWRYTDLSRDETVQDLLAKHQLLAEEIYADVSFRNEFASIAKLWHSCRSQTPEHTLHKSEGPVRVDYMSYDDLLTDWVNHFNSKTMYAASRLHRSLRRGVAIRYQLGAAQALRLVAEVVERHMRETYGTGIFNRDPS